MAELEMTNEAESESEAFTDDLSDEALDREPRYHPPGGFSNSARIV